MSLENLVNVPAEASGVARALERHPDYRVLRRLTEFERPSDPALRTSVLTGVALDVETTGLDHRTDRVIELAMRRFGVDEMGRIVDVGDMVAFLEDPGVPISEEITKVTGLTAADLKGKSIRDGQAGSILLEADFVVSHNASFDRPFVDARLPSASGVAWACTLTEVDWRSLGFQGRRQSDLIADIGGFYDAHRASVDVNALLHLLDHTLPSGSTVLAELLDRARRPTFRLDAHRAPRGMTELLRARGWRWATDRQVWSITVDEQHRDDEVDWATIHVYSAASVPSILRIDWTKRYAA